MKDEDKLSSDSVKKSLEAIKNYRAATKDISDMLVMEWDKGLAYECPLISSLVMACLCHQ